MSGATNGKDVWGKIVMSTISVYTTCTNAIRDEYFLIEGIKSALLFADEVVIMDGKSIDDTIERIKAINDPRIKLYENEWLPSLAKGMYNINKSLALGHCTSDWCILMDSDEVFHEDDIECIKEIPENVTDNIVAIEFNVLHFYKDYKHILNGYDKWPGLYTHKIYMVRNHIHIHHGHIGTDPDLHVDLDGQSIAYDHRLLTNIKVFHYGHVRTTEVYLRKRNWLKKHLHASKWVPETLDTFEWLPVDELERYNGTHPAVMKERIATWEQ